MNAKVQSRQVIARYSILKLTGLIVLVAAFSVWIFTDGASRGGQLPRGRGALLFPAAVVASGLGLVTSVAMILNVLLSRGAAIAKVGDDFVFYFPFSRKRLTIQSNLIISEAEGEVGVPAFAESSWVKVGPTFVSQLKIRRAGAPDLNMPTGLLREKTDVIAGRMRGLLK